MWDNDYIYTYLEIRWMVYCFLDLRSVIGRSTKFISKIGRVLTEGQEDDA